jgi:heat shock protein 4
MKNAVEQYVYDNRAFLDTYGDRAKYADDATREAFLVQLNQAEEWLYNDGEDVSKDDYEKKLHEL